MVGPGVVSEVFRCVCDPAVAPPTRAYRGAWIRSSQPKDVAEATVQARQRPARSVLPSVVGCLPQCYYTRSETEFSLAPLYSCASERAKLDLGSHGGRSGERVNGSTNGD